MPIEVTIEITAQSILNKLPTQKFSIANFNKFLITTTNAPK